MELKDLFVSHKLVDPVVFSKPHTELPRPIYLNFDRALKVTSGNAETANVNTEEDDMNWVVGESETTVNTSNIPVTNNSIVNITPIQKTSIQANTSIPTQPVSTQVKSQQPVIEPDIKSTSIAESNTQPRRVNRWTSPYKDLRRLWITDMTNAYKKLGLNDNAIKNLIAKNAFESGWGKSAQGAFNFGNITTGKYWKGNYVQGKDTDADGNPIGQKFRAYNTIDDYVKDEIDFLTKLYDFNQDDNFDVFINKLLGNNSGKRRYAEARDYVTKVKGVYNSI